MIKHSLRFATISFVMLLGMAACGGPPIPAEETLPAEGEREAQTEEEETSAEPTEEPTSTLPGFEPAIHNADWSPVIQNFDGVEMALAPVGCFMMGSNEYDDEQPIHEVCFEESFWIDVYEVTNGQFGPAALDCNNLSSGDNQPRICVSWDEAEAYCEARGARLPTEAEWEYAARGPDGLIYPWGNAFVADNVVYSGNPGRQAAEVGSRPGGVSWVGAYDLSGNVWEWVADWYDPGYYARSPVLNPQGPESGSDRVVRGGSWELSDSVLLRGAVRLSVDPVLTPGIVGFRCARDD
jgi:sulfatase modifying factor 1